MDICVMTGGGSGMGLAAAGYMDKKALLLAGRILAKLERAAQELRELGFTVFVKPCLWGIAVAVIPHSHYRRGQCTDA